jgi:hypothetical protein
LIFKAAPLCGVAFFYMFHVKHFLSGSFFMNVHMRHLKFEMYKMIRAEKFTARQRAWIRRVIEK